MSDERIGKVKVRYTVTIETDTVDHADEVIGNRLSFDDDYGFDYTIDATRPLTAEQKKKYKGLIAERLDIVGGRTG